MPFIAECPYCKKGKLQCSDKSVGWSGTCPNPECGLSFTLVKAQAPLPARTSGPRSRPRKAVTPTAAPAVPPQPQPAAPADAPRPAPANPFDVAEAAAEAAAKRARPAPETLRSTPALQTDADVELEPPRSRWQLNPMTMLSFVLAGVGLIWASLSALDLVPYLASGFAIVVGIAGVFVAKHQEQRVGLAGVGPIVGALTILLVAVFPTLLNPMRALNAPAPLAGAKDRVVIPLRLDSKIGANPEGKGSAVAAPEYVDASKGVMQFGDLWLRLTSATLEAVELDARGKKRTTPEKWLVLRIQAANNGVQRRLDYQSWADVPGTPSKHPPILQDNGGRPIVQRVFPGDAAVAGQLRNGMIMPGKWIDEVLVFEQPNSGFTHLRLQLPLSAFGQEGVARWEIPRSMVVVK